MTLEALQDIPRIYTALAEWGACVAYILPLKKRVRGARLAVMLAAALILQCLTQLAAGRLPIAFWIPGMMAAVGMMYLCIFSCCDISALDAGYCSARAFITAEFAASFGWQLYYFCVLQLGLNAYWLPAAIMLLVYGATFSAIYYLEARRMPKNTRLDVTIREFSSATLLALAVFLISNLNFVFHNSFGGFSGTSILYIRTLVDFSGLVMLFAQQEQRREIRMRYELEAMDNLLHRQYEQYQLSKENIDLINRKYHDLKHQIAIIRAESDPAKREFFLADMDHAINVYEAQNKTGNSVLDTVLTGKNLVCLEQGITMTCVADGQLLRFMDVMDICTIFGNALDNAIESVKKLADTEKRLIRVALFSQNGFLMIRFENYYEDALQFEDGLPQTTKKNTDFHGYGIKSIRKTAEKYGGHMTLDTSDNWFVVCVLIPIPPENTPPAS